MNKHKNSIAQGTVLCAMLFFTMLFSLVRVCRIALTHRTVPCVIFD